MIQLHDVEQGSPEWQELRAPLYTGSNADKLLKFGAIEYSRAGGGSFGGNFFTRRGHLLEEEAIELYQQITGQIGIRLASGRKVGFVTNSAYPGCGYSPDDLYPDRTIEVKAFTAEQHLAILNGEIPFKVLAQCHFGMMICGKELCDFLPYNPSLDVDQAFKIITIRRRRSIVDNFKRKLAAKEAVKL